LKQNRNGRRDERSSIDKKFERDKVKGKIQVDRHVCSADDWVARGSRIHQRNETGLLERIYAGRLGGSGISCGGTIVSKNGRIDTASKAGRE
jgi:hypothetical protein